MTVAIVHDKRRITTTGENAGKYPIKIRLTYKGDGKRWIQKLFPVGVYVTADEFKKITGNPGKNKDLQNKQTMVYGLYEKGKAIVKANPFVDPDTFVNQLTAKGSYKDPLNFMLAYADEMGQAGRIGNRDYYRQAHSSFKKFSGGIMTFAAVTPKWLLRYESWMIEKGKSITSVGMYTTAMRTIFNLARSDQYKTIPADMYPFGKGKYQIPSAKGRKMALTEVQKDIVLKYKTLHQLRRKAVDMWIFSYYCFGMNFADIARLRYKDIQNNYIVFDRAKTALTERNKDYVPIEVRPEIQGIINHWGSNNKSGNEFIFGVLRDGLSASQVSDRIHDFIADTNKHLGEACEQDMKLPKITTYWARHTFATIMRNKGVDIAMIQKMLGHANESTTQSYFGSFPAESLREATNNL